MPNQSCNHVWYWFYCRGAMASIQLLHGEASKPLHNTATQMCRVIHDTYLAYVFILDLHCAAVGPLQSNHAVLYSFIHKRSCLWLIWLYSCLCSTAKWQGRQDIQWHSIVQEVCYDV